jgi:hypothetical protein
VKTPGRDKIGIRALDRSQTSPGKDFDKFERRRYKSAAPPPFTVAAVIATLHGLGAKLPPGVTDPACARSMERPERESDAISFPTRKES